MARPQGSVLAAVAAQLAEAVLGRPFGAYCCLADRPVLTRAGTESMHLDPAVLDDLVSALVRASSRWPEGVNVLVLRSPSDLRRDAASLLGQIAHFLNGACMLFESRRIWSALRQLEHFDLLTEGPGQVQQLLGLARGFADGHPEELSLEWVSRLGQALANGEDGQSLDKWFTKARSQITQLLARFCE